MEGGHYTEKKEEEPLDPILMDDDQLKWILASSRMTRSRAPYQYKVNTKKRVVARREGLASDEEEVEDLRDVEQIEEILHVAYERKTRGPRIEGEDNHPFNINVSVEPINRSCATNTQKRTPSFRQPKFEGSPTVRSTSTQRETTGGSSSGNLSQVSTPRGGGSSSIFGRAGHDPTIRLPEFQGEATDDPEKHLFICAKIWEAKKITDEDTKLTQLEIMLRDRTLDWYMSLYTNSVLRMTRTLDDIKKLLINEF
jgi:hypothetical protein